MSTSLAAADLINSGFSVCRIAASEKRPSYPGWACASIDPADVQTGHNIGINCGPLSGAYGTALVCIDLDDRRAVELADSHLPPTAMIEGRTGKPRSHRWYLVPNESISPESLSSALVDITPGLRVRLAVPPPGPEKAMVVGMQPLVPINSAAIRRDGRYIAVGLDDRTIVLWDTADGRPVRTLAGHQKAVLAVAFTPDGKRLVSSSADATAILWDVEAGVPLRTYKGHTGPVVSLALSPDASRLLTGSSDGTAIFWDTESGEVIHKLNSRNILGVAYSPDGATLATSSADRTATLWDAATGKQKFVLRGHREDVNCVSFSPDSLRIITGSSDDVSMIWDVATGRRIIRAGRHSNNIHSAVFTPDGRRVISGEREELVMMWDAATGANVRTFAGHGGEILSIVPAPDGRTMLTASRDGTARLWDLTTGRELLSLTTDGARKTWAVVSADGHFDASDAGRRALGYRFTKLRGGEVDQFFAAGYRPGLLAEVWRGERPFPVTPPSRGKPPLVKLAAPKDRGSAAAATRLAADVADQGGDFAGFVVENNGVPLAVPTKAEPAPGGKATRVTFTVPLAPGSNRIRVRAADRDGSRESAGSEVELALPRVPGQRGRLYVVAVGVGDYAEKALSLTYPAGDARALAELLRVRGGKLYDRVDVVPVFDRDGTRTATVDLVKDVAELTRPQDAVVVTLCGRGARTGERVYFAPHQFRTGADRPEDALRERAIAVDDIAAALGTAPALSRALVVDAASLDGAIGDVSDGRSEFGLRGVVERWGRSFGVHAIMAVAAPNRAIERPESNRGFLARSLLDAAAGGAGDVTDWFLTAAERATSSAEKLTGTRQDVEAGTRSRGFPILGPRK